MAGEIFISYRRADEAWARLLHSQLQGEGVEAWYDAHVGAGQDWRAATAAALSKARIFVLLFSKAASQSDDIAKELAAATFSKKLVVPVRIENIQPEGAFLYELASRNWVNAFENTEAKLAELAQSLAKLVKAGIADESIIPFDRNAGVKAHKRGWLAHKPLVAAAAAVAMTAAVATLFWLYPRPAAVVASAPPLSRPAGVSVAVLPFLNLSSDKDQEFFSDGITEEITSALAKVPGLTVIGRTSAFQFKGKNKDMRAIGKALGANNLIEGSIRKDGNQIRVTAQLIKAADGTHLWTESYDRELKGIFAVQEEIATAIAGAMQVPLGLKQGQSLVSNRTADTDSYQDYLRAKTLVRVRTQGAESLDEAATLLERVVARDPNYAPAWALLGQVDLYKIRFGVLSSGPLPEARRLVKSAYVRAEKAEREAIRLDPQLAVGYQVLGNIQRNIGNWAAGEDYFRRALMLAPNNPDILFSYASTLSAAGRLNDAQRLQNQVLAQESFDPIYRTLAADLLWAMGQNDAVIRNLETQGPAWGSKIVLAKAYATAGRYEKAADTLFAIPQSKSNSRKTIEDAARLLRSAPAKVSAPEALPVLDGEFGFVYLFIGAADRSFEFPERGIAINFRVLSRDLWGSPSAALRKTERFKTYVRNAGLLDYWRARGWPDLCHPVGANDFACN